MLYQGQYLPFETVCERELRAAGIDDTAPACPRSIRIINRLARASDEPHLWPHVAAAESAIRWYRRVMFPANGPCMNVEYAMGLAARMSEIVNRAAG
jgi:hypothetical protein